MCKALPSGPTQHRIARDDFESVGDPTPLIEVPVQVFLAVVKEYSLCHDRPLPPSYRSSLAALPPSSGRLAPRYKLVGEVILNRLLGLDLSELREDFLGLRHYLRGHPADRLAAGGIGLDQIERQLEDLCDYIPPKRWRASKQRVDGRIRLPAPKLDCL